MKCKWNDCGYCYEKTSANTNDSIGRCIAPLECPEYKSQQDEFNIACDMEPVGVFDATSHTNSEWEDVDYHKNFADLPEETAQEWEDGLPPVGVECEYRLVATNNPFKGEWVSSAGVRAYYGDKVWFINKLGLDSVQFLTEVEFRPILTEAQKAEQDRDEAIIKIQMILSEAHSGDSLEGLRMATDLYDAGYRLKDTKND